MTALLLCISCLLLISISSIAYASDIDAEEDDLALVDESSNVLTEAEIDGLLYMFEEEKLAGDVYQVLYNQWKLPVFSKILPAERTHQAAVEKLLVKYGIDYPKEALGSFQNPKIQSLYDYLIAQGSLSIEDALRAGVLIEVTDIDDIEMHMAETDREDILRVYANLLSGSESHLKAFISNLEKRGYEYTP